MKKCLIIAAVFCFSQQASNAQSSGAFDTAYRVARKVKESLALDSSVMFRLCHINLEVYLQKTRAVVGSAQIQDAERYRDTAYRRLMTDSLFQLYLQRKQTLLTGN